MNPKANDYITVVTADAISGASTTVLTYADATLTDQLCFVADISAFGTSVDLKLVEAKDNAGTDKQDLGVAITQVVADNTVVKLAVSSSQLSDGYTHVAVEPATVGASVVDVIGLAVRPRNLPFAGDISAQKVEKAL